MTGEAAAERWIDVVAAVIERPDGSFLLAQRPEGKVYAGWWEFPGGKVESGEPAAAALARELHEELGIEVRQAHPWLTRRFRYPHGNVRLQFFRVTGWSGEPQSRESQAFAWQRMPALTVEPVLPANGPILKSLRLPLVMGVTDGGIASVEAFRPVLDHALSGGLRCIQVRAHALSPIHRIRLARAIGEIARPRGALVFLNGSPAEARESGVDGVHLTARALAALDARPDLEWVGASCHDAAELDRTEALGLDYAVLGPVLPTTSHPGVPGTGWVRFAALVAGRTLPVFAIGGLGMDSLETARTHGAHGVAAIRAAWR